MQNCRKSCPQILLLFILAIVAILYVQQLLVWIQFGNDPGRIIFQVFFHLILFMLLWSMCLSTSSDPGQVPFKWGYYLDEEQTHKRRFCMNCQVFKPQRCHHCSNCNRCVLNMDHHCPWINNCIGFANRKPFILMLVYADLTTFLTLLGTLVNIPQIAKHLQNPQPQEILITILAGLGFILGTVIFVMVNIFLKFHLDLLFSNYTTIEYLQRKRLNKQDFQDSPFDLGLRYNFYQVFGQEWWTYPFPIFVQGHGPVGDGVLWPRLKK